MPRSWPRRSMNSEGGVGSSLMPTSFTSSIDNTVALGARMRAATELLESIGADRSILDGVPDDDRRRLLRAASIVRGPASQSRRRLAKATAREERAARVSRDEATLSETG